MVTMGFEQAVKEKNQMDFEKRLEDDLFPGLNSATGIREEKLVVYALALDESNGKTVENALVNWVS